MKKEARYIFITGGVCSSLGKGLTAAAVGALLEQRNLKPHLLKLDPYLNIDPGTMDPFQHGEVYVTEDGAETDLDLGHYHRFTLSPLSKRSSATTGQIYNAILEKERKGVFQGSTVQIVPHITNEIKHRIRNVKDEYTAKDVVIVEIGGTCGDIEAEIFLEAIRQFRAELPPSFSAHLHLTYVPYLKAAGEFKSKPSQHSLQLLHKSGLFPDIVILRSENRMPSEIKKKIALSASIPEEHVIEENDLPNSIYELPLALEKEKLDEKICNILAIKEIKNKENFWKDFSIRIQKAKDHIPIAVVGKYVSHNDAYKSLFEALEHSALSLGCRALITRVASENISFELLEDLRNKGVGFLIPGGFGERGAEDKLKAITFCREHQVPCLGICLGMQLIALETARSIQGMELADSLEFNPKTPFPIIDLMEEQKKRTQLGGSMRLGSFVCQLEPESIAYQAYRTNECLERHRHRFEVNPRFLEALASKGITVTGREKFSGLTEIIEHKNHPWMVGVQFHPEFISTPKCPHPIITSFLKAIQCQKNAS